MKKDAGKPRWELVPFEALEGMVRVLEFGAEKYSKDGWKELNSPEDQERIMASLLRHTFALMRGETFDPESGLPHVFHMQCNTMFLGYFEMAKRWSLPLSAIPFSLASTRVKEECTCLTLKDKAHCDKQCNRPAIIGGCE
jgi:hypothetical protein